MKEIAEVRFNPIMKVTDNGLVPSAEVVLLTVEPIYKMKPDESGAFSVVKEFHTETLRFVADGKALLDIGEQLMSYGSKLIEAGEMMASKKDDPKEGEQS